MLKSLKILLISFILLFSIQINVFAKVASFQVILNPNETQVGKAVDVTVKAIDENGNVDKNFKGTILFIEGENTNELEVEYPGFADTTYPSYTFTSADEGVKKFENSIKFLKEGNKAIAVVAEEDSADGEVSGEASIKVGAGSTTPTGTITLNSPTSGETIAKNSTKVTGETKKNHKIKIKLNDNKTFSTISDSNGFFEYEITSLANGANIIQVFLLDGDEKEIAKSKEVNFSVSTTGPGLISFTIDPEDNIKAGQDINIEVRTEDNKEVNITFNDAVYSLKEEMEGKYIANITAPEKAGEYPIDLEIAGDLGKKNIQKAIKTIKITEEKKEEPKKEEPKKEKPKKEEPKKEEPKKEITSCETAEITGLKLTKLKTKSILSWDKVDGAKGYKVFKKENDNYNLIEAIDTNRYTIFIKDSKKITYADFVIKSVCEKDGKEIDAKEYSKATKIQTGPKETILLIFLAMLLSGLFFIFSRKKQS